MNTNFNPIQQLNRRRSAEGSAQNSRGWAVATPLCAACQPPNAFGFGGRYRPTCSRIPRSVAGRVVGEAVRNSESHQPEENNIFVLDAPSSELILQAFVLLGSPRYCGHKQRWPKLLGRFFSGVRLLSIRFGPRLLPRRRLRIPFTTISALL